jgi:hypothetical protein
MPRLPRLILAIRFEDSTTKFIECDTPGEAKYCLDYEVKTGGRIAGYGLYKPGTGHLPISYE